MLMTDEVFTVKEVSSKLKVSEQTVRRMIKSGEIKIIRMGIQIRIPKEELDRLLERS